MKKIITTITLSALVGTSASNLKPMFTSNVVSQDFKSSISNKEISIHGDI